MVSIQPFIKSFVINFTPSTEYDVEYYKIHAAPESDFVNGDFTPSESNLIAEGPDTTFLYNTPKGGVWGLKISAVDTFGEDLLNYSQLYTVTVPSLDPLDQDAPNVPAWVGLPEGDLETDVEVGDTQSAIFIKVAWELADVPEDFLHFILSYKVSTDTTWSEQVTTDYTYKLANVLGGLTYDFRIKAVDQWNNVSAWSATKSVLALRDTIPPAVPSGVSAVSGFGSVTLFWTNATDYDLAAVNVYRNTVNEPATAVKIASVTGTTITDAGLATGVTYYYWLKSVDTSGNESLDFSAGVSASPIQVMPADLDISARVDFVVRDTIFLFDHVELPGTASTTLRWTAGSITRGNDTFALAAGSLTAASNSYIVATCSGTTAVLSKLAFTSSLDVLAADQVVIGFTSASPLIETNNYVCYVRQTNSMALEGASIRDATITDGKIKNLTVDKLLSGIINATEYIAINNGQIKLGNLGTTNGILVRNSANTADIFKVDGSGEATLKNLTIDGLVNVGTKVSINGATSALTVSNNAGTITDMVTVGKLATNNYGLSVKDKSGNQVFRVDEDGAVLQNLTAGTIDANKVTINNLVVGSNVTMGADAYISWGNVSGKPSLVLSNGKTTLGEDFIYTGTITANKVTSGSFLSRGSYLTTAVSAGATSIQLLTTENFPSSGSGWVLDAANDKNAFSWTGKTSTSLTGCTGLVGHDSGCAVIPRAPGMVFDSKSQELRIYGYNTTSNSYATVEQLFTCGIKDYGDGGVGSDLAIAKFGNETYSRGVAAYFEAANQGVYNGYIGETVRIVNYTTQSFSEFTCALRAFNHNPVWLPPDEYGGGGYWYCDPKAEGIVAQGSRFGVRGVGGGDTAASSYGAVGVYGYGWGVYGTGVEGVSTYIGVEGSGDNTGVYGRSTYIAVMGSGGRYDFYANGSNKLKGTVVASFTGAHEGLVQKSFVIEVGDIVVDCFNINNRDISQNIFSHTISTMTKQNNVVGVLGSTRTSLLEETPLSLYDKTKEQINIGTKEHPKLVYQKVDYYDELAESFDLVHINALGDGSINVCKDGGNIYAGDYICSSSRPGKGMKQDDDLLHNYTVAKAREDCIWLDGADDVRMIACTYHCG